MSERTSTIRLTVIEGIDPINADFMAWAGIVIGEHIFVLCTEGVGWDLSNYDEEKAEAFFGIKRHAVRDMIRFGTKTVMLKDFVREFGSRLESNYWQNHRAYVAALLELEEQARANAVKQAYADYCEGFHG